MTWGFTERMTMSATFAAAALSVDVLDAVQLALATRPWFTDARGGVDLLGVKTFASSRPAESFPEFSAQMTAISSAPA